mgnify:CR=1 FL=1
MQNVQKSQIKSHIVDWLAQGEEFTQSELGRLTDVNRSTINQIAQGKWTETTPSAAQWRKLGSFFDLHSYHIESYNYKAITGACARAQAEKLRVGVTGSGSGDGKTYALESFAQTHANVYIVKCRRSMRPGSFLNAICRQLGVSRPPQSIIDREDIVAERLTTRGALLIIDECEFLGRECWDTVKSLCDMLERRAGIVLSGLDIKEMIAGWAEKGRVGMPQLNRRFDFRWVETMRIEKKEIAETCKSYGIEKTDAVDWFRRHVKNYDALSILLRDALSLSERSGQPVTAEFLHEAFNA